MGEAMCLCNDSSVLLPHDRTWQMSLQLDVVIDGYVTQSPVCNHLQVVKIHLPPL